MCTSISALYTKQLCIASLNPNFEQEVYYTIIAFLPMLTCFLYMFISFLEFWENDGRSFLTCSMFLGFVFGFYSMKSISNYQPSNNSSFDISSGWECDCSSELQRCSLRIDGYKVWILIITPEFVCVNPILW